MTGGFPESGPAREAHILAQVRHGLFEVEYATVVSDHAGHHAEFQVFADALKIDGVRVNVSARTQQGLADMLGCMLLTPKLADLAWFQRTVTLPPMPRPITATTAAMLDQSAKIDAAIAKLGNPRGLVGTVGKHWVVDNDLSPTKLIYGINGAENYGWHFDGASYQGIAGETVASGAKDPSGRAYRLIQGRGWAHNMDEVDYSQVCVLVMLACKLDGQDADLRDVLRDPALAPLASHNGPMTRFRQPGVAEPTDHVVVIPAIRITVAPDSDKTPIPGSV